MKHNSIHGASPGVSQGRKAGRQVKSTLAVGFNEGIPNPTKLKMVHVDIL
jgi:hypothetical protein